MDEMTTEGGFEQASIDAAVDALSGLSAPAPEPTPTKPAETAPTPTIETKPEAVAPKPDPIEAIVKAEEARRVSDLQRQRDDYAKRLQALEASQKPVDQPPKKVTVLDSPDEFARAQGFRDAAHMAKFMWSKKMPDSGMDVAQDEETLSLKSQMESMASELRRLSEETRTREEDAKRQRAEETYKQTLLQATEAHLDALPHVKAFLATKRTETVNTLHALAAELGSTDPGISPAMVAVELEKRMANLAPKRISELKAELSAWEQKIEAQEQGQKAPATKPTSSVTLTSADGALGKNPTNAPVTEQEMAADAAKWLEEELSKLPVD